MKESVDLEALDRILNTFMWTRVDMERSLGKPILSEMEAEDKREMWERIKLGKEQFARWRAWFPKATVLEIREAGD